MATIGIIATAAAVALWPSTLNGQAPKEATLKIVKTMKMSPKSDSYDNNMIGILFYGYKNYLFPCTSYAPGEIVLFKASRFQGKGTMHEQALNYLVHLSHAMKAERVIATGFAIQGGVLKFKSSTLNSTFQGGDTDRVMNPVEQRSIKMVVDNHFGRKFPVE